MSPLLRWQRLVDYLEVKVRERDWHGVSDAANDLRVLEAEHPRLKMRGSGDNKGPEKRG